MGGRKNLGSKLAKKFESFVRSLGFKVERAYLFGSRVSGEPLKNSDLDAVIVSQAFEGQNFFERMTRVSKAWFEKASKTVFLEPLCYTPKEFAEKSKRIGIVSEAVRTGVRIV